MAFRCGIQFSLVGESEADGMVNECREFVAEGARPYLALDAAFQKLLNGLDFKVKLGINDK